MFIYWCPVKIKLLGLPFYLKYFVEESIYVMSYQFSLMPIFTLLYLFRKVRKYLVFTC